MSACFRARAVTGRGLLLHAVFMFLWWYCGTWYCAPPPKGTGLIVQILNALLQTPPHVDGTANNLVVRD